MAFLKAEDDCATAADVLARAKAVRDRLKEQRSRPWQGPAPKRVPVTAPLLAAPAAVEPVPAIEVAPSAARTPEQIAAQMIAYAEEMLAQAEQILGSAPRVRKPLVEEILRAVSAITGKSTDDIRSNRRTVDVVIPRQLVMALARRLTLRSLPVIGNVLGGRDHTTVLHGARKLDGLLDLVEARIGKDAPLALWVEETWGELTNGYVLPKVSELPKLGPRLGAALAAA